MTHPLRGSKLKINNSVPAAGQVPDAAVHRRGGGPEDTHGKQLQAASAPQGQDSAIVQLTRPRLNLHSLQRSLKTSVNAMILVVFLGGVSGFFFSLLLAFLMKRIF